MLVGIRPAASILSKSDDRTGSGFSIATHSAKSSPSRSLSHRPSSTPARWQASSSTNSGVGRSSYLAQSARSCDFGQVEERTLNARSEEHTSELQSLLRISYAVFCLKKKKT